MLTEKECQELVRGLHQPGDRQPIIAQYHRFHQQPAKLWKIHDNYYAVADYHTVQQILRSNQFSSERVSIYFSENNVVSAPFQQLIDLIQHWLIFTDGDQHAKLRRCINQAFSRQMMLHIEPIIKNCVCELLDPWLESDADRINIIKNLAEPLPMLVIAKMLGANYKDGSMLKALSDELADMFRFGIENPEQVMNKSKQAALKLQDYFLKIISSLRKQPKPCLIQSLLDLQTDAPEITDQCIASNCSLVLLAGHETTTSSIGNTAYFLDQFDLFEEVLARPEFALAAAEESLRFSSPVQALFRTALEPSIIHGQKIQAGDTIEVLLAAANRDPSIFEQPDHFILTRNTNKHLSFGFARHLCSGAQLARLEIKIFLEHLQYKKVKVNPDTAVWRDDNSLLGLSSLYLEKVNQNFIKTSHQNWNKGTIFHTID